MRPILHAIFCVFNSFYFALFCKVRWSGTLVVGATIAGLITWNMVDRYENVAVSATPNGVRVNVKF